MHRWPVSLAVILCALLAAPAFAANQNSIPLSQKAKANGVASLNSSTQVVQGRAAEAITAGEIKKEAIMPAKLGLATTATAELCLESKGTAGTELQWKTCGASLTSESVITAYLAKEAVTAEKLAPGLIPGEEAVTVSVEGTTKLKVGANRVFRIKLKASTTLAIEEPPAYPYTVEVKWTVEGAGPYSITWPSETAWSPSEPAFGKTTGSKNQADLGFAKSAATKAEAYAVEGKNGTNGSAGAEGKEGKEGKEGVGVLSWKGVWSSGTTYALSDAVTEEGSSYVSIKTSNTNHKPSTETTWWKLLAEKGAGGGESTLEWHAPEEINANLKTYPEFESEKFAPLVYAVGVNGLVHLSGTLELTGTIAGGALLFRLPVGARPTFRQTFDAVDGTKANAFFLLAIKTNGEVKAAESWTSGHSASFAGLSFPKEH